MGAQKSIHAGKGQFSNNCFETHLAKPPNESFLATDTFIVEMEERGVPLLLFSVVLRVMCLIGV